MRTKELTDKPGADKALVNGIEFKKGDKLKLKLGARNSDASDILLNGRIATIETIYTDYDDKTYLAVTLDDDPGRFMLRELNIYRFFLPDEVEIISHAE